MDEVERELEDDRRQKESFRRIHRLVKRGYAIDWSISDVEEAFWLDHPGEAPGLIFYPDGIVVARRPGVTLIDGPEGEGIGNRQLADVATFDRWLATVPVPTWRQRTRADRNKYIKDPGCVILLYAALMLIAYTTTSVWHAIFG